MKSKWNNKKVLFIGDSITARKEYPKVIEEILGIQSFYHCGIRNIKKEELQYVKNTCFPTN